MLTCEALLLDVKIKFFNDQKALNALGMSERRRDLLFTAPATPQTLEMQTRRFALTEGERDPISPPLCVLFLFFSLSEVLFDIVCVWPLPLFLLLVVLARKHRKKGRENV